MAFTMSFRTGKDGNLEYGERPLYREECLRKYYDSRLNIKSDLGFMFVDFISLTGNLANSNHPFLLAAGDTCEGISENSHFFRVLKEYVHLGIENTSFFKESCFMFFLQLQGLSLPAIQYDPVQKENYIDKAVEDFVDKDIEMSSLERTLRGFIAAENEMFEVPYTTYSCETVEDACIASLHFLITHNCNIRKCQNCGMYFIAERSDAKYCDRTSPFNTNTTCKIDGAQRTHRTHSNEDELDKKIRLKKKARYQYYYRHSNSEKACRDYDNFMDTLKLMQKDLKSGAITKEQFIEWLEEQ